MARIKKGKRTNRVKEIVLNYIQNHIKEFLMITIVFLIGLVFGVIFVNHMNDTQEQEITSYISEFGGKLQQNNTIDKGELLKESVASNLIVLLVLWFAGCTVVGMPILYGVTCLRGFCLGYTVSVIFASLEFKSAILFIMSSLILQNLLFLPALFALVVSGINSYQSIMKDRAKSNIKMEIYRHTIFSCFIGIILIASSFVEVYLSTNLFLLLVKQISFSIT